EVDVGGCRADEVWLRASAAQEDRVREGGHWAELGVGTHAVAVTRTAVRAQVAYLGSDVRGPRRRGSVGDRAVARGRQLSLHDLALVGDQSHDAVQDAADLERDIDQSPLRDGQSLPDPPPPAP